MRKLPGSHPEGASQGAPLRRPLHSLQERGAVTALSDPSVARPLSRRRRLVVLLSTAAVVVALDQVTKTLAVQHLTDHPVHVIGPLDLQLALNPGVAFSLGRGLAPALVVGVVAVVAVAFALLARSAATLPMTVAVGVVLGGAAGNLADRIFRHNHGAVIDFVALHFWPTFNVADAAVVIGEIALVIMLLRRRT